MKSVLSVIAKNRADGVVRLFESTNRVFDAYVLVDTGSDTNEQIEACQAWCDKHDKEFKYIQKKYPEIKVDGKPTLSDFSAARNDTLELAKEIGADWYFWADSDDVIKNADLIPELIKVCEQQKVNMVLMQYEYAPPDPVTGKRSVVHPRERLVRMNQKNLRWVEPVHENLISDDFKGKITMNNEVIVTHLRNIEESLETGRRNKIIMDNWINEKGIDNVSLKLLRDSAFDAYEHREWSFAIDRYIKWFGRIEKEKPEGKDQMVAENLPPYIMCLLGVENRKEALHKAFDLVMLAPELPISHIRMAECALENRQSELCISQSKIALTKISNPNAQLGVVNEVEVNLKPLQLMGEAYLQMGKLEKALKVYTEAYRKFPNNQAVVGRLQQIQKERDANRAVKAINTMQLYLLDDGNYQALGGLRDAIPEELIKHPTVKSIAEDIERDYLRHISPMKLDDKMDIVFWVGESYEPWTAENIKTTGLGGSEEMVVHMARELAALGNKVRVYNRCNDKAGTYDKVEYINFNAVNPSEIRADIVIIWRQPQLSWVRWQAKKVYLWLHDTYYGQHPKRMFTIPNKVMVLTEAHKEIIKNAYGIKDDAFWVTRNGFDTSLFPKTIDESKRDPHAVIYGSSYDRGLEQLLEMWGDVKKEVPDAKLHVCYGWVTFDKMMQQRAGTKEGQYMAEFKAKIESLLKQDGVIHHGRVGGYELAEIISQCGVAAYPTWFSEISCISMQRYQALGAVPVVTPVAALKETVQYGYKIGTERDAQMKDKKNLEKFRDALINVLKNPEKQNRIRSEMMAWAKREFDVVRLAKEWHDYFKEN